MGGRKLGLSEPRTGLLESMSETTLTLLTLSLLLAALLRPALPTSENSDFGDRPLKLIFACQWYAVANFSAFLVAHLSLHCRSFTHLAPFHIKSFQPIPDSRQCNAIGTNPDLLYPALRDEYLLAGNDSVGIPTQEWEKPAWLNLSMNHLVMISEDATLNILGNKLAFKDFMRSVNLSSYVPAQYHSLSEVRYPCVLKLNPMTGTNSKGIHIVRNESQLIALIDHHDKAEPYLLEEAIVSKSEICFSIVAHSGELLQMDDCLHFSPKNNPLQILDAKMRYRRSRVACQTLPHWDTVAHVTRTLVARSGLNGLACVQYKYTATKDIKILEVNPRLCAGLTRNPKVLSEFLWRWWRERPQRQRISPTS